MNTIKTITTVDGMNAVDFGSSDGNYYWFRNLGDTTVYVSGNENIIAGADGVAELTSGGSVCLEGIGRKVYILGAGKVEIHKSGNKHCPFKVAPDLGGGKEVSGSAAYTIENAVDYPLMGLNLYGKSTQDGTPTPENPVEIVSVGDGGSVNVKSSEKNVFKWNDYTKAPFDNYGVDSITISKDNIQFTRRSTNGASFGGVVIYTDNMVKNFAELNYKTVTMSCEIKANNNVSGLIADKIINITTEWEKISYTYTFKSIDSFSRFRIFVGKLQDTDLIADIRKIQLEISDTATAYEPYKGTTVNITSALPLCGIPVAEGGNYTDSNGQQWVCDELIYNADGSGKITKRTAKIDSYNSETITTPYISTMGGLTTGATIIYQLAEPQKIELTAVEMSALMSLQTFGGITNISNDGGAEMSVGYCTNKMLSEYVVPITTGLQKQIDELKSAVLSLGGNI